MPTRKMTNKSILSKEVFNLYKFLREEEKKYINNASKIHLLQEVVKEKNLTRSQKIKILRQWEYDARELEVAEEENMQGVDNDILPEVLSALAALGADMHGDGDGCATKQG